MRTPKTFAAARGDRELNEFLKSPYFTKMISPAKLDPLGAGLVAVVVMDSTGDAIGVRTGGELLLFHESEMIENVADRIKHRAGIIPEAQP